jgi:hypothetical protein
MTGLAIPSAGVNCVADLDFVAATWMTFALNVRCQNQSGKERLWNGAWFWLRTLSALPNRFSFAAALCLLGCQGTQASRAV